MVWCLIKLYCPCVVFMLLFIGDEGQYKGNAQIDSVLCSVCNL